MYSGMVKEYINANKSVIFDAGYEYQRLFKIIPYKTFLKIIERLVDSNNMVRLYKGVYAILDESGNHETIDTYYTRAYSGVVVGKQMYNNIGISDSVADEVIIYTKKINNQTKTFANYKLINIDLFYSEDLIKIMQLLDCIENYEKIEDINMLSYSSLIADVLKVYDDTTFKHIIEKVNYKYSTILNLHNLIKEFSVNGNPIRVYENLK